ncbi:MAG: hypothetical protein JWN60_2853 [Acidobacteria bacterium]|jgi:hypothetical protein|nr:hypothetical protein [Acidobacteriota bacterium]
MNGDETFDSLDDFVAASRPSLPLQDTDYQLFNRKSLVWAANFQTRRKAPANISLIAFLRS